MNRHEVEKRLIQVEAKVKFIMHTLALTRKDTQGATESRTFDTLFEEALKHDMDGANFAQVAQRAFTPPPDTGGGSHSADGPDGFPRADSNDATAETRPTSRDSG